MCLWQDVDQIIRLQRSKSPFFMENLKKNCQTSWCLWCIHSKIMKKCAFSHTSSLLAFHENIFHLSICKGHWKHCISRCHLICEHKWFNCFAYCFSTQSIFHQAIWNIYPYCFLHSRGVKEKETKWNKSHSLLGIVRLFMNTPILGEV